MTQKRIGVGVEVYIKDPSVEPGVALKGTVVRASNGDGLYVVTTENLVNLLCHPDNLTPVVRRPIPEALPKVVRGNWDSYFMRIAREVSSRATCDRKHVGCVLVNQQKRIISTGYNGSVRGAAHCDDVGHDIVDGYCVRTIHAEMNAVLEAARSGVALGVGFTAYITTYPCWPCARALLASGVLHIVYDDEYREDKRVLGACEEAGVTLRRLTQ